MSSDQQSESYEPSSAIESAHAFFDMFMDYAMPGESVLAAWDVISDELAQLEQRVRALENAHADVYSYVLRLFETRRYDPAFHLGLGDIRLTIADQETIIAKLQLPESNDGVGQETETSSV